MCFEELWAEVHKMRILPEAAIHQIPQVLSVEKKKISMQAPESVARMISEIIEEINHGSVESIDSQIRKRLH